MDDNTLFGILTFLVIIVLLVGAAFAVFFIYRKKTSINTSADATLHIYSGNTLIKQVPLTHDKAMTIGRGNTDILLTGYDHVSRQHAHIFFEHNTWMLEDNNSKNGTFVNHRPIVRRPIQNGDVMHIGPLEMYLDIPEAPPDAAGATRQRSSSPPSPAPSINRAVSTHHQTHHITSPSDKMRMFGPFALIRQLGSGGIARVWLARNTQNGQIVALKQLIERDEFLIQKFAQEGGLRLDHPHIAQVFDANQIAGQPYIAMEYIDGPTLTRILPGYVGHIDIALAITGQILLALDYAHAQGIVHRDIKPDNIMLSSQEGVKVIDFGIARVLTTTVKTQHGLLIGTPRYMSYEQATGNQVNITSDLYSVAIMLYEFLTGQVPFAGDDIMSIIHKHLTEEAKHPTHYNANIPAHIEQALMQAMDKNPDKRFQSAQEFAHALGCPLNQPLSSELMHTVREYVTPLPDSATVSHATIETLATPHHTSTFRIYNGTHQGKCIVLTHNLIIGRQDIDPNDHAISRQHFRIEQTDQGFTLYDISSHGTIINTSTHLRQGESCYLEPGTTIQVGQTILNYDR